MENYCNTCQKQYKTAKTLLTHNERFHKENDMKLSIYGLLNSVVKTIAAPYYLHSYIQYTPNPYDYCSCAWMWQFIPKTRQGKYSSFVTLEYILLQKNVDNNNKV